MNTSGGSLEASMPGYDILDLSADAPIILVGEGKSLRGELRLRNPGPDRIQLSAANLHLQVSHSSQPIPYAQVSLPAGLPPGQSQRVKMSLDFDPLTPPGEYKGELDMAGHTRAVIVYVAELIRLAISPQVLVIDQPAGSIVSKNIILTNEGNVPLTFVPIGKVALGEELMLRRSLSVTVAAAGEKEANPLGKIFADLVHQESKAVLGEAGTLMVVNASLVLQPGESRQLGLEIHLPDNLSMNSRYIGRVPLYTSDLEFVVVPHSVRPAKSPKPEKESSD